MSNYQTLITNIGLAKLANATASGDTVNLTELAVGDGNGIAVTPDATMNVLVNEVWRGSINSIATDDNNPSHLKIECVIPTNTGGWWMREVGVFDDEGDLIIIANYPDTHKTLLEDGAAAEFRMMVVAEFTNASTVTLQIDPAVVMASKDYVDQAVAGVDLSGLATEQYVQNFVPENYGSVGSYLAAVCDIQIAEDELMMGAIVAGSTLKVAKVGHGGLSGDLGDLEVVLTNTQTAGVVGSWRLHCRMLTKVAGSATVGLWQRIL